MTSPTSFLWHRAMSLVVANAALAASAAALAGTPIDKRAPADPAGSVEVSNIAGSVAVSAWDNNEVQVTGSLGDGTDRLEFTSADKVTRIKVILPKHSHNVEDTDLVIRVPAASRLAVNTVSADIGVKGVTGGQRLQSVSGDVHTEAGAEDVECKTVSGDVRVDGSGKTGMLTITTVSGDVTALRVAGEANANTVSGDMVLGLGRTTRTRIRSTSGDLTLAALLTAGGKVDAESISGDVRITLLAPVDAEFDLSSFNGDIHNCFGPKPESKSEYAPGKELHFSEGAGSGRVWVKTLNGDISICRK
jgi:DUF4097 and DUF4098 domain-containing protein YvlB